MIVDSSALVEIEIDAPRRDVLTQRLAAAPAPGIGTPTLVEIGMVLEGRLGRIGRTVLARSIERFGIEVIPFGDDHWPIALRAFATYGRGRHPARLNFGDCLTYATAKLAGEPLLCVGDDFAQTDLELVPLG